MKVYSTFRPKNHSPNRCACGAHVRESGKACYRCSATMLSKLRLFVPIASTSTARG
jgi:hypothetical protein